MTEREVMEKVVSLAKRRGSVFPGLEIYPHTQGTSVFLGHSMNPRPMLLDMGVGVYGGLGLLKFQYIND